MKNNKIAFCYDFDNTLSPDSMQEYGFIKDLGMTNETFWKQSNSLASSAGADSVLTYMYKTLTQAKERNIKLDKNAFKHYGKRITFFSGVETWFKRVNVYAKSLGLSAEHYIISAGLKEMIEGTKIAAEFKEIFASSYIYENSTPVWPALAVNYTNKTQFLFRISKGCLDVSKEDVNDLVEEENYRIPFTKMIYFGDGYTDVPCMKLLKDKKGYSVAVYNPKGAKKQIAEKLKKEKRADYALAADYGENSALEKTIFKIIKNIAASK
jgi:phosphoserine phosphatase